MNQLIFPLDYLSKPPLLLIADDDRAARFFLRVILEKDSYEVVEAEDGAQALSIYKALQPDLVLLDAMMPVMDGFTACARIRAHPGGGCTPILMITALKENEAVERAFGAGATDYIIKPVHKAVLHYRVAHLLRGKRADELQAIFKVIPDICLRLNSDGVILAHYAGSTSDLDVPPGGFIGKYIQDIFPTRVASPLQAAITEVHQTGNPSHLEYSLSNEQRIEIRFWPFANQETLVLARTLVNRLPEPEVITTHASLITADTA